MSARTLQQQTNAALMMSRSHLERLQEPLVVRLGLDGLQLSDHGRHVLGVVVLVKPHQAEDNTTTTTCTVSNRPPAC